MMPLPCLIQAPSPSADLAAMQQKCLEQTTSLLDQGMKKGVSWSAEVPYLRAVQSQADLVKAWQLTERQDWLPQLRRRRDALRFELACRLQDSARMRAVFPDFLALKGKLDFVEAYFGIQIAIHLGQWKVAQSLGHALKSNRALIDRLHANAREDLTQFDYASILDLIDLTTELPRHWELEDRSWSLQNVSLRVQSSEANTRRGRQYMKSFREAQANAKPDADGWLSKNEPLFDVLQIGAAAHWIEGVAQPPVSGFITSERLLLRGYSGDGQNRMVQSYDMRPVQGTPGRWQGTCRMEIFYAEDQSATVPSVTVLFGYRWDMKAPEGGSAIPHS